MPKPELMTYRRLGQLILERSAASTRLVAVDGGSGKTTFSGRLVAALGGAPIVPTDDFASAEIPIDWWPRMRDQLIVPLRSGGLARYQRYDWPTGELAEWVEVPRCPVVIIEGVSSGRLEWASELAFLIWVDSPRRVRLARGLERDGAAARQLWLSWMAAEDRYRRLHRPKQRADLIVAGAPTSRHDLASEFLQLPGVQRTTEDHPLKTGAELVRLRELCLTFPEVVEDPNGVGSPSFKVVGKIFVMHVVNHHGDGQTAFWCKARQRAQLALTSSAPEHYFIPPYVGRYGWIGVRLDRPVDWVEVEALVEDSYRLTAPGRLVRSL